MLLDTCALLWLAEDQSRFSPSGVSDHILMRSVSLPHIHADPANRIIIATAVVHNLPVITADSRFNDYGVRVLL